MNGDSSSEAKTLPPSKRKLQQAREKGQIAKSADTVSAISITVLTIYLILAWPTIFAEFSRMFDAANNPSAQAGVPRWKTGLSETWGAATNIVVPLLLIGLAASIVGSLIANKGVIFSAHPLKPDLKRISPFEGFKRIFGVRNAVEFLKALLKCLLLLGALGATAWLGLSAILRIPYCGFACVDDAMLAVVGPLVLVALLLFIFAAVLDVRLQNWLFARDMRMTRSELKREMKEAGGDPQIRNARNMQQRATNEPGRAPHSLRDAMPTIVVCDGTDVAVSLRYDRQQTAAPVVIGKGTGPRAANMFREALDAQVPVKEDAAMAQQLMRTTSIGSFVPEALFHEVARMLNHAQRK